jgi:hypothetical protein
MPLAFSPIILFEHFGFVHGVRRREDMPAACGRMRRQGRRRGSPKKIRRAPDGLMGKRCCVDSIGGPCLSAGPFDGDMVRRVVNEDYASLMCV